jgi:gliding motility-associated-like protein
VTEPPQVIPVISGPTVVCEGQTNTLTATGGSTYVWGTGATTAAINISPVVATTYTVTATVSGCTGITSHTVTVSLLPNATLSGDTLLCPGETTPFTASGGDSYVWSEGSTGPVISVNMADEGLFYVIAFNSCGADTAFTTIVVDSLNLSFSITDVTCFGDNDGSIVSTVAWGVTPYTYSWSTGASTSVISGVIAGIYSLDVTDAYGCTVTAFATVNQPPPVVAAIMGTAVICEGQTITLAGSGGTSYNWSNGATGSSTTVSPSATTTYTLYVSTGPCSDTATYTVTVNPLPNATVSGDGILCPGETTTLTANGGDTYVWNTGGTGQTATMDNTNAGMVYVIATNGCGADTAYMTITSDSLTGVYAGEDQSTAIGISVDLEATGGGISYTWTPADDLSCSTCANPVATPLHTTTYTVISQNANGCTDSDEVTITVDETVSVLLPDIFSPNGNGINDVLLVRGTGIRGMVFRIYDRWGQKIFESLDQAAGWDGTFNGKQLDTGVFVYTLTGTFYTGETFEKKGNITLKR